MGRNLKDWKTVENDKEKYAAYLCSREWAEKRESVRKRARGYCERCWAMPMDACHHLTYERKYHEDLDDLQAICNPCHEFTHGKCEYDPSPFRDLILYLNYGAKFGAKFEKTCFPFSYFRDHSKLNAKTTELLTALNVLKAAGLTEAWHLLWNEVPFVVLDVCPTVLRKQALRAAPNWKHLAQCWEWAGACPQDGEEFLEEEQ